MSAYGSLGISSIVRIVGPPSGSWQWREPCRAAPIVPPPSRKVSAAPRWRSCEPRPRGLDLRDRVLAIALSEPLVPEAEAHNITNFEHDERVSYTQNPEPAPLAQGNIPSVAVPPLADRRPREALCAPRKVVRTPTRVEPAPDGIQLAVVPCDDERERPIVPGPREINLTPARLRDEKHLSDNQRLTTAYRVASVPETVPAADKPPGSLARR
jgi:hypothetical protein